MTLKKCLAAMTTLKKRLERLSDEQLLRRHSEATERMRGLCGADHGDALMDDPQYLWLQDQINAVLLTVAVLNVILEERRPGADCTG